MVPTFVLQPLLLKNHEIVKNSTTTNSREKISTYLESLEFYTCFNVHLTQLKSNQILLKLATDFY